MGDLHDTWLAVHGSEDGGATYDPDSNTLASVSVKGGHSPQRYDRIWAEREWNLEYCSMFMSSQLNVLPETQNFPHKANNVASFGRTQVGSCVHKASVPLCQGVQ